MIIPHLDKIPEEPRQKIKEFFGIDTPPLLSNSYIKAPSK